MTNHPKPPPHPMARPLNGVLASVGTAAGLAALPGFANPLALATLMGVAGVTAGLSARRLGQRARPTPIAVHDGTGAKAPITDGRHGTCLGTWGGQPLFHSDADAVMHTCITGASGSGKTTLILSILAQQIARGGGAILVDAKVDRRTRNEVIALCHHFGRLDDLRVINIGDPENSHTYGVTLRGTPPEITDRILLILPDTSSDPAGDFFKQVQKDAVEVTVGALIALKRPFHLGDIAAVFDDPTEIEGLMNELPECIAKQDIRRFLKKYRKQDGEFNWQKITTYLGSLAPRLMPYARNDTGRVLNSYNPDLDLFEALQTGKIVLVQLPTMRARDTALNFAKIFLADLRTAIAALQDLDIKPRPFKIFLDEFGSYYTDAVIEIFQQARSAGIQLYAAFQTYASLDRISKENTSIVLGNCWADVFLSHSDAATAKRSAEFCGQSIHRFESASEGDSKGRSSRGGDLLASFSSNSQNHSESHGWSERRDWNVDPDELMTLPPGKAVVRLKESIYSNVRTPYPEIPADLLRRVERGDIRIIRPQREDRDGAGLYHRSGLAAREVPL